ncbi:MAG: reverse transcriptase-like protein [Sulfurospirillum sp.]|nr:reverse transcriptase-like protein [Sulfurospirillum sp.]
MFKKNINKLKIFCDGACSNNPGNSGSGIALYKEEGKPTLLYGDYQELGTNNTAELNALYKALEISSKVNCSTLIEICSDSKYSIDCISKWAYSWKSKNWKKKGGEIKNLEIIKKAHTLFDELQDKITLSHVKAHAGIEGNELADRMAVLAIVVKNREYKQYSYENINKVLNLKRG